jgi:predicted dehydrogenase
LNDIIVHAVDFVPWATGLQWKSVVAARCWNATVPQHPHFSQCGQAMLTLDNDAGVICDVSYLTPDSFAYEFPLYWRFTVWGSNGVVEAAVNSKQIALYQNGSKAAEMIDLPAAQPGGYLDSFLAEIHGDLERAPLRSADALAAASISLKIQAAADQGQANTELM